MKRYEMKEWASGYLLHDAPVSYSNGPSACEATKRKKTALLALICALTFTDLPVPGAILCWLTSSSTMAPRSPLPGAGTSEGSAGT
jgi:hypothetical protein